MPNFIDDATYAGSQKSTIGDIGNATAAAAGGVASAVTSSVQYLSDLAASAGAPTGGMSNTLNSWRQDLNAFSAGRTADMSAEMQDMLNNPLNLNDLKTDPIMYLGGQIARQVPALVTTMAAIAITRNPAIGAGLVGGTLAAGDAINQVYNTLDGIPDEELQNTSQLYRGFRTSGMDEAAARAKLRVETLGAAPAVLAAIGAATNILGGAGELGRLTTGSTAGQLVSMEGKNFAQRALIGGAVAGGVGAVGGAASDAVTQMPLVQAKLRNFDTTEVVNAALQGGVVGAAMGGVADAIMGGHAAEAPAPAERVKPNSTEIVQPGALGADEQAAMRSVTPEVKAPEPIPAPPTEPTQVVQPPSNVPGPVAVPEAAKAPIPQQSVTPEQQSWLDAHSGGGKLSIDATGNIVKERPAMGKYPARQAQASITAQTAGVPFDVRSIGDVQRAIDYSKPPNATAEPAPAPKPEPAAPPAEPAVAQQPTPAPPASPVATPPSHDAVFSAASKTATIAKAVQKISDITGAPVEQVQAALKNQTVGKDVAGIRDTAKTWLANAKPLDDTAGAKHRGPAELQVRADANSTAQRITDRFGPNPETEKDAAGAANTPGVKEARVALANRVGKMVDAANEEIVKPLIEQKVEFPSRFKDNTDKSADWNEHVLLLAEAQRLYRKINNKSASTADYQRFLSREHALRGGDAAGVKSERRSEGDQAFRKGVVSTTGDVADTTKSEPEAKIATDVPVTTKVPKSAKKPMAEGKTGPASAVRKVALTAEEKAKYEKPAAPKPEPVPAPKEVVAKVKAKARADRPKESTDPSTYKGPRIAAVKIGGEVFIGHVHADAVEKAVRQFGEDSPQIKAFEENPEASIGMLAGAKGKSSTGLPYEKGFKITGASGDRGATIKQRIAAAAKQVETKPTPAQAEAGNYAKGHVSIHGLDIAIENPRGSTRSGTGPDGKPWSVKMPDHYGYIKRTAGADGDHVDVYVGPHPESEHVFLVEQRNAETGKFDEHKAMLGYDNAAHAMSAYERAFSDGKAADRFGSIKPMSVDEFKTWLKEGDTTKPTDEFKATEKHLASEREKISVAQTREGVAPTPYVRARNAVANWLNGLSDREYHDLEAAHFARPLEETDGQSIPQMLDNADSPAELGKIYRDLKTLHEQAHPVTSEVPVPPHTDSNPLISKMGGFDEKIDAQARTMYHATKEQAGKTLAYVKEHGTRYDPEDLLQQAQRGIAAQAANEARTNAQLANNPTWENSYQRKVSAALAPSIIARLKALTKGMQVYSLPDDAFYTYNKPSVLGYYDPVTHHIAVPDKIFGSSNKFNHVMVHEFVHAAFKVATENNPIAKGLLTDLMNEARGAGVDMLPGHTYAFTNEHEFIAEALSNPALEETLGSTPLSDAMATRLGIAHRMGTVWDGLVAMVRKVLGLPSQAHSILDGIMRVADAMDTEISNSETGHAGPFTAGDLSKLARDAARRRVTAVEPSNLTTDAIGKTIDDIKDAVESRVTGKGLSDTLPTPKMLKLRTLDQIAQVSKRYGEKIGTAVRGISDALEGVRIRAHEIMQEYAPHILEMRDAQSKFAGPDFDNLVSIMHDATMAGVHPNKELTDVANDHVVKTGYTGAWQRAQHATLKAKFDALPAELKTVYEHQLDFYKTQQDRLTLSVLQNRIGALLGSKDDVLAKRIFDGTETDADKKALGSAYDTIKGAEELSKIKGAYFPLMREGTHVVTGEYKVADPRSPSYLGRTADGEYEFSDKEEAGKFAAYDENSKVRDLHPTLKTVHVDPTTGKEFGVEPDGTEVRLTAKDTNAVPRYRVAIQNKHVEFVDGELEARRLTKELQDAGLENVHPEVRLDEHGRNRGDLMSTEARQLQNIIEKRDAYKNMSAAQKFEVQQAAREMALRYMSSTRIQSRALPRKFVAGASRDYVRSAYKYAMSVSSYLGKLHKAPELEKHMLALEDASKGNYQSETSLSTSAIHKEVLARVNTFAPFTGETGKFAPAQKRLMALSFFTRMLSPAHSVIHAMQPWMLSMPVLGARHGYGRTSVEMTKAYNDIGAGAMVAKGIGKTFQHMARPTTADASTFMADILKSAKNADERAMFQHLMNVGTLDPDAGFELGKLMSNSTGIGGALDKVISYLDGIARQLPRGVDTIGRAAVALSAYRMELKRNGGNHEAAMLYAQEVTNLTQGNYSSVNAAPVFNHPLFKMSLQFKKYGQMVYGLIGHQIGKAIMNVEPGDRAEAFKSLATIAAMHIAIAGVLGLPTEPFKWMLIAANAAGVTKYTWSDVENWERQVLAHMVGKGAGELLARGVTRMLPGGLGFDVSGRLGLSDLMSFGEPKSNSPDDITNFMYDLVGGAPGSLLHDYINGAQAISAGDFPKAAGLLVPIKAVDDAIKAYQGATQGKINKYGQQTLQPYSMQETLLKAFGFTPARQAETNDANSQFYNETQRNKAQVQSYQQQWAAATPSQRMYLWGAIEKYNQTANAGNKLTRAQLDSFARNKAAGVTSGKVSNGLQVNSKTRSVLDENASVYATQ